MKRILKYEAPQPGDLYQHVKISAGPVVHFGRQGAIYQFWIEHDGTDAPRGRTFASVATGMSYPDNCAHRGTLIDGALVWHLVERIE